MSDYWDSNPEMQETNGEGTFVRINGANIDISPGSNFKDTIKVKAEEAGLGKFRVFLGGSEIKPSEAPNVIEEGMQVELRPYDIAG
jgi:hypothetical protein